jgi:hypothetical protein
VETHLAVEEGLLSALSQTDRDQLTALLVRLGG